MIEGLGRFSLKCRSWFFHRWGRWTESLAHQGWQVRACLDCGRTQSRWYDTSFWA